MAFFKLFISLFTIFSFSNSFAGVLPKGYTELEYIESNGKSVFDTGVVTNNSILKIDYDFQILDFPDVLGPIIGGGTTYGTAGTGIQIGYEKNNGTYYFYNMEPGTSMNRFQVATTNRVSGSWVVTGSTSTSVLTGDLQASITSSAHFGNNKAWRSEPIKILGVSRDLSIRLFPMKIYLDNVIVRDFIPVRRNSDGVIGMYDTIGNKFYTNSGTSEVVNTCTSATIMGENVCLIDAQPNGDYINVRYNNEQYYLMLDSENDYPIHVGSGNKLKIITDTATYNVHDESVVE